MRRHLIVMVKEPRPGRVKTRLARDIGPVAAAWWYRHQVRALLRRLDDPRWRTVLAVAPDRALHARGVWPGHLNRQPQGAGDLGRRMARLLTGQPPGPAVLVGSDIPDIAPRHIARAFDALGGHDAVFGPAPDGGYWLVGFRNLAPPPPGVFRGVRWSSRHALTDSMATLPGWRIGRADTLADIDTAADLARVSA